MLLGVSIGIEQKVKQKQFLLLLFQYRWIRVEWKIRWHAFDASESVIYSVEHLSSDMMYRMIGNFDCDHRWFTAVVFHGHSWQDWHELPLLQSFCLTNKLAYNGKIRSNSIMPVLSEAE